jgi:outer membrane protein assembly factor BamB
LITAMSFFLHLLAVLFFITPLESGPEQGNQWSRFRGPNGTGKAVARDIPVDWDGSVDQLWKISLAGKGNSSPIGWGRQLFLQTASENGRERILLCIDSEAGKILWTRSLQGAPAKVHQKNTLATSTPATDGERVYALSWDGDRLLLSAFSVGGEPVWSQDLGPFKGEHGAGVSPIVYGGRVFLANDQDDSSSLLAFDSRTGEKLWQAPRPAIVACYSTPLVLEMPGRPPVLVASSSAGIAGYDPVTGREFWNWAWVFPQKPLRTVASPVYSNGFLFANSGEGGTGRHFVAVRLPAPGESGQPRLAWDSVKSFPYVSTILASGDHIYWVNDSGIAGCNAAATGQSIWMERLGGSMVASPILVGGKIFAVSEDGDIFVFSASTSFRLYARNSLEEVVRATPAVVNGRLVIRGSEHLFCFSMKSGHPGASAN